MLPFDVPEGESMVHKVLRYSDITKISDDRGESYFRNISTIAVDAEIFLNMNDV